MSAEEKVPVEVVAIKSRLFALDTWAVVIALLAALLVRLGLIKHIPW